MAIINVLLENRIKSFSLALQLQAAAQSFEKAVERFGHRWHILWHALRGVVNGRKRRNMRELGN
ncbi:MAG: hypothetical protein L0K44_04760 [Yaniella sp.]|nr:hypothetical protein [Yaniella sp.]